MGVGEVDVGEGEEEEEEVDVGEGEEEEEEVDVGEGEEEVGEGEMVVVEITGVVVVRSSVALRVVAEILGSWAATKSAHTHTHTHTHAVRHQDIVITSSLCGLCSLRVQREICILYTTTSEACTMSLFCSNV